MHDAGNDFCPHCFVAFEIVSVKFRFGRVAMVAACPNCAVIFADEARTVGPKRRSGKIWRPLQATARAMGWLDTRFRLILAFLLAAVLVAALLRHGFHVYGGMSREEIRRDAFLALPGIVLLFVFLRKWRRR